MHVEAVASDLSVLCGCYYIKMDHQSNNTHTDRVSQQSVYRIG